MKIKFYIFLTFMALVEWLPAQESEMIFTIGKPENGKFNKKDIIAADEKNIAVLNVTGLESLDLYDKNTLEFVKNVPIFKTEGDGGKYEAEFYESLRIKLVENIQGKLFIFTQKTIKENKIKQQVVYCTVLDEKYQVIHYLKEVMSADYVSAIYTPSYGSIGIEFDEESGQILLIHQPLTEPKQSLYINTKVLDFELNILSQGIIELPFKAAQKAGNKYLIPVKHSFRNNLIYSYLHIEAGYENQSDLFGPDEYIAVIGISDPATKNTRVIPLDLSNKKLFEIMAYFVGDQLKIISLYQNTDPKKKNKEVWYHGFFSAQINEKTYTVENEIFSEFTPRQISDLANANNLIKQRAKEEDIKNERVNGYLSIQEIILADNALLLVGEYKHDYINESGSSITVKYDNSKRGSICLFKFSPDGQLENINSYERTDHYSQLSDHRGHENVFTKSVLYVFKSKKEQTFNIFFSNTLLRVDIPTLEIQSHAIDFEFSVPYRYTLYKENAFVDENVCYFYRSHLAGIQAVQYYIIGKIEN